MLAEMGCLMLGVPVGYALRNKPLVIKITNHVLTWSVRILLLLLGLALGADDDLMSRMDSLGVRGTLIGLCCVAGSLVGARLLEPFMTRSRKKNVAPVQHAAAQAVQHEETL